MLFPQLVFMEKQKNKVLTESLPNIGILDKDSETKLPSKFYPDYIYF